MKWHRGMKKIETQAEMDEEYYDDLMKLLEIQADTEFASIQQHRPWLDTAPTPEDRWLISRILMEEMRHGWQMCQILTNLGRDDIVDELLHREPFNHKLDAFNLPFDSFYDVVAFTFFIDRVGMFQLNDFKASSFGPLYRAMDMMIEEEKLHIGFGTSRWERFLKEDEATHREPLQEMVRKWYPRGLDMFGRKDSSRNKRVVEFGIKATLNEELRQGYIKEIKDLIVGQYEMDLPDESWDRKIV